MKTLQSDEEKFEKPKIDLLNAKNLLIENSTKLIYELKNFETMS